MKEKCERLSVCSQVLKSVSEIEESNATERPRENK